MYKKDILRHAYECIKSGDFDNLHVPSADTYYVYVALKERNPDIPYTIREIEEAMIAEGWVDA